jgi:hypothetical protein
VKLAGDADGLAHVGDPVGAGLFVAAGGGIEPHGGDHGTDDEPLALDLVGEGLDAVVGDVDVGVRIVNLFFRYAPIAGASGFTSGPK